VSTSPPRRLPRWLWPRSLAGRTALTLLLALLLALMVVQAVGLTIHAFDRIGLERLSIMRDIGLRVMSTYRAVAPELFERIVDQTALAPAKGAGAGPSHVPARQAGG